MTAHPTEARRRTTIDKLARVFAILRDARRARRRCPATTRARAAAAPRRCRSCGARTSSARSRRRCSTRSAPGSSTSPRRSRDVVPALYRDLEAARGRGLSRARTSPVPPLLTFGSWMGGDRDGNPHVTPEVTARGARADARRAACASSRAASASSPSGVSLSERVDRRARRARAAARRRRRALPGARRRARASATPRSPTGARSRSSRERVRGDARATSPAATPRPDELLADLRVVERTPVATSGGGFVAARRPARRDPPGRGLRLPLRAASTSASTPTRPPRTRSTRSSPRSACATATRRCPTAERCALLAREIATARPLIPQRPRRLLGARRARSSRRSARCASCSTASTPAPSQAYIVSGTEGPADLLEVLLLMKEAGLARAGGARRRAADRAAVRGGRDARERAAETMRDAARRSPSTARRCARSATSRR